jgi:hypothetical protein
MVEVLEYRMEEDWENWLAKKEADWMVCDLADLTVDFQELLKVLLKVKKKGF